VDDGSSDEEIPVPKKRSRRRISSGESSVSGQTQVVTDSDGHITEQQQQQQQQQQQIRGNELLSSLAIEKMKKGQATSSKTLFCGSVIIILLKIIYMLKLIYHQFLR